MTDFEIAKDKVLMGAERKSMVYRSRKEIDGVSRSRTYLGRLKVPSADPVHKVSIIPRGMALGVTQQLPEGDRHSLHERIF